MKLSGLGEKGVVSKLRDLLPVGDDAFVLPYGDSNLVLTTDMVFRPTHILDEMSWSSIGRHIVAINFSDIAAMGAKPNAFLLSFGSEDILMDDFSAMVSAASDFCKIYGAEYVGGDVNETDELTLAGFALGETDKPVYRSGANSGDLVCVTGTLGGAALGVKVLTERLSDEWDDDNLKSVLDFTLETKPRVDEGYYLRNCATSMTDISDSLAVSLNDIAAESTVGIMLEKAKIPLSDAALKIADSVNQDLIDLALFGGGDYELLFTVKPGDESVVDKVGGVVIGEVVEGECVRSGKDLIEKRGFEHFKSH